MISFTITAKDRIQAYCEACNYITERQLLRDNIGRFEIPALVNVYDYGEDDTLETEFEFQIPIIMVVNECSGLVGLKKIANLLLLEFGTSRYKECIIRTIKIARVDG